MKKVIIQNFTIFLLSLFSSIFLIIISLGLSHSVLGE